MTPEQIAKADPYYWYEAARGVSAQRYFKMEQKYTWTDYEWEQIELGQILGIIIPFNDLARKMYISRNLWTPVRQIMEIDLRMGSLEGSDIPRYQVHSLHCHNVANVLVAIAP